MKFSVWRPFRLYSGQTVNVCIQEQKTGEVMNRFGIMVILIFMATACTPTVKIEAPDKPIEINMNINIKHEILIKVEKQVEELLDDDLF